MIPITVFKIKPRKQVNFFLPIAQKRAILPYIVSRVSGDLFKGSKGDTVSLKIEGLKAKARDYEWRTRAAPIVFDDIFGGAETTFKLNKHVTSATYLTDEHLTMDDIQYAANVTVPQAEAIVADYEVKVLAALRSVASKQNFLVANGRAFNEGADPFLIAVELRRLMNQAKRVPAGGRTLLVGSDVAAQWVASKRLSDYQSTGQEGTPALREAIIGRLAGTTVVEHEGLNPNEGYYIHKSALGLASVAPVVPNGVNYGATGTRGGFGIRHIGDYDPMYLRDRAISSSFLGVTSFRDETNPDGSWIFEEDDVDEDDLSQMYPTDDMPTLNPNGTRKNVRVIPFEVDVEGTVLPAGAFGPTSGSGSGV